MQSDLQARQEFKRALDIYFITNLTSRSNFDKSRYEKYIPENLDNFLHNYKEQMYSIPITSLYNIFEN